MEILGTKQRGKNVGVDGLIFKNIITYDSYEYDSCRFRDFRIIPKKLQLYIISNNIKIEEIKLDIYEPSKAFCERDYVDGFSCGLQGNTKNPWSYYDWMYKGWELGNNDAQTLFR